MKNRSKLIKETKKFVEKQKVSSLHGYIKYKTILKQFLTSNFTINLFYSIMYSLMIMFILTLLNYKINFMLFLASVSIFFWYQEVIGDIKDISKITAGKKQ